MAFFLQHHNIPEILVSVGALRDGHAKHIRDKHNISMATRERQPPSAQSKTTSIYNTVLSLYIKVPYPNIIQVILWRFKIIKLKKSA